ncbi:sugar phosphate isomerase/epimerase family protein [Aporhodopirellula aestuarii]|uniref:Sugar phosphate isomerase/epimerase n=1 Tax=Aporhodopirellula aestuarii TaxID=2950107 RepID=A0ABT0U8Q2_9BACT|nr:sugar phosphate isomerase/epimerase family protein [Aporhodopirellula aestuarii]MCM2372788.1 sugar phosphate isomerase/epimerase [Aporhodopirellula aestuarii]
MPMRFALCNETFRETALADAVRLTADLGYTGWEVAPFMLADHVDKISPDNRVQYRRVVEDAGLEIIGLHWLLAGTEGLHLTTRDEAMRKRTSEYFTKLTHLCGDLGGSLMVLGSPLQRNRTEGQSTEEALANAASVLREALPALHERNVRIAIEPLGPEEGDFLNTADEGCDLIDAIGDDHIGLHLDVKAMSTEDEPIDQIIRRHADRMIHFHANDPNRLGPGMGSVKFEPIMQAIRDVGYDGWVSVEVFDYSPGAETLARESIQNLKAAM